MYEDYWQLSSKPFEASADARFRFAVESQQSALNKLRYAVDSRRSAALVTGSSGVGKTALVQTLREQLRGRVNLFAQVVFPLMSSRDLLCYLAEQLGAPPAEPPHATVEESLCRLEFQFAELARRNEQAVVVVDEAHLLEDSGLLETLRLLLNLEVEGRPAFTLILVGQPGLLSAMERNATLDERLDVKMLIKPFTVEETADYIEHRLVAAGATRNIFASEAMPTLHQLTGGVARRINRLCDLALVVGFAEGQHTIDAEQLRAVHNELVTIRVAA